VPEQKSGPVVAIDGPSGAGKSTVAKTLATAIEAAYLDTGAMYRAATLAVLNAGVDPSQTAQVTKTVKNAKLGRHADGGGFICWLRRAGRGPGSFASC